LLLKLVRLAVVQISQVFDKSLKEATAHLERQHIVSPQQIAKALDPQEAAGKWVFVFVVLWSIHSAPTQNRKNAMS
jgi:hypothetical protein